MSDLAFSASNDMPEAGSSKPRYTPPPPPPPRSEISEIIMTDVSVNKGEGGGRPDEAAELLLSISSVADERSPAVPLKELEIKEDVTSGPEPIYPYTPPDDPQPQYSTSPRVQPIPNSILPPDSELNPTSTPLSSDPTPKSAKSKRKRSAPVNRNSSERRSTDPPRPAHWMGEDNTQIRCICGFDEDDGFTIQCEGCGAWEHGSCFGYLDEATAPETYFCELCVPRPFDAAAARQRQLLARAEPDRGLSMQVEIAVSETILQQQKDRPKPRNKPKRPRQSTVDAEIQDAKAASPGVMGPPSTKPKRKPSANKPRSKSNANANESSGPGVSSFPFKDIATVEVEHEYFRDPWKMEYTPISNNIAFTKRARMIMAEFFEEWRDADLEEAPVSKRTIVDSSGLPSPTNTGASRLSPEHGFLTPDFDILAPPVPPVFLSRTDLDSLAPSVSVKSIKDHHSFLPLNYAEEDVGGGVYTRPAVYGVFVNERIASGAFAGEFRGSIVDCETYRKDPINQYAGLGIPKPFVRSVGPPLNLIIDARGYGNELRFTRSGCHPNVVLRPLMWRKETGEPRLKFGLFASRAIDKNEELILGWEWDDAHVVHSIQHVVMSLLSLYGDHTLSDATLQHLVNKYDSVLSHMFGTFTACACRKVTHCAVHQMRLVASYQSPKVEIVRGKAKLDFGELIGAVRGWRRNEIDMENSKRWHTIRGEEINVRERSRSRSVLPSDADTRTGDESASMEMEMDAQSSEKEETEEVEPVEEEEEEPEEMAVDMTVEKDGVDPVPFSSSLSSVPGTEIAVASSRPSDLLEPIDEMGGNEADDGDVSDATTATEPRSHFSDDELDIPRSRRQKDEAPTARSPLKKTVKSQTPVSGRKAAKKGAKVDEAKPTRGEGTGQNRITPAPARRGRKVNRVASSGSEDEVPLRKKPSRKSLSQIKPDALASSLFSDEADKLARVPEQTIAPMAEALEITDAPADVATEEFVPTEEARMEKDAVAPKEPTPPPAREPTPPPREPTPEPPKKVSLSDYLKSHKIRKESQISVPPTPTEEIKELPVLETAERKNDTETVSTVEDVKAEPGAVAPAPFNFSDFLPAAKPTVLTNGYDHLNVSTPVDSPKSVTGYTPGVTPTARSDYFPAQSTPSTFVPRQNSAYTPRQNMTVSTEESHPAAAPNSTYVPRQPSVSSSDQRVVSAEDTPSRPPVSTTYVPRQQTQDESARYGMTPPKPTIPLAAELTGLADRQQLNTPPAGPRMPPTGPKAHNQAPPTGPRSTWKSPGAATISNRGPEENRMWGRGRGGYPGRGRGRGGGFGAGSMPLGPGPEDSDWDNRLGRDRDRDEFHHDRDDSLRNGPGAGSTRGGYRSSRYEPWAFGNSVNRGGRGGHAR
ncbi:hypothetical protein BD324DRAFT_652018 [Kockovaella imperatae]|uniref:SET domain-containing protein n=1 Tax=Kockovaella imperatae TaxID=4999 RepID=A0A1Y1UGC3_9TREE|nr:hypothetical protein BD324DRAFT_652018 [Kockovaella imperatae]ORX36115.1 hypothetical protein BD324DRAFT_652018 [Kockovaella imperatae]